MTIPENYKKPLIYAVLIHVVVLLVLILNFAPSLFRMPPSSAPMSTVHATMVTEAAVHAEIHATQSPAKEMQEKRAEAKVHEKLMEARAQEEARAKASAKQAAQTLAASKLAAQKKLLNEKAVTAKREAHKKLLAKQDAFKKLLKDQALAAVKQDSTKTQQAKAKKLMAEQKKLQQQLMQQQMASEQKNISTVVSQAQEGAIDKYKAAILSAIQSNWRIDKVDSKLKCIYSVTLAPDGSVMAETLMKSSGDDDIDQSAKQAIIASSPLPVPTDPALFDHFRQLVLTLSPQGYLQSVGNS